MNNKQRLAWAFFAFSLLWSALIWANTALTGPVHQDALKQLQTLFNVPE